MLMLLMVCFPVYAATNQSAINADSPLKLGTKKLSALAVTTPSTSGVGTDLSERKDTPINKQWTITFPLPMDQSTFTSNNIKVLDNQNNIVQTSLVNSSSSVVIVKPTFDYKAGARYCLVIGKSIKSATGNNLADDYFMYFNIAATTTPPMTRPTDADTDGDGLTDYQEIHKYITDPNKADSDGDGILDSDVNERTEYTYVIKTAMRIKKPYNFSVMNDDYQDVRLVSESSDYGVFDITLYPYNTNAATPTYDWRTAYQNDSSMQQYLKPTITANWDEELQTKIIADLKIAGIDVINSTYNGNKVADNQIVERTANWLLSNTQFLNQFTTFYTYFPNGAPAVYPGLESRFQADKGNPNWSTQQQFEHETLGKQMYLNKSHGSCTSTAVLWNTVFRAIGIPTRMIMTVPIIDGNDPNQKLMISNISDAGLKAKIQQGTLSAGGFASHTYNEVYVGGRWTRLNYNTIAQNIIDPNYFGAMIHFNTMNDLAEVDLIPWGQRYALNLQDSFQYGNPYETTSISSANGIYSKVVVEKEKVVSSLQAEKVMTYDSSEVPTHYIGHKANTILIKINTADNNLTETEIRSFIIKETHTFLLKDANGNTIGTTNITSNNISDNGHLYYETRAVSVNVNDVVTVEPADSSKWKFMNNGLFK